MTTQEQNIKDNASLFYTNSTAMTAAMVSLGFALNPLRSLVRVFTKNKPKGTMGIFHFILHSTSTEFVVGTDELIEQWRDQTACEELDDLVTRIATRSSQGVLGAAQDPSSAKGSLEEVQQLFNRLQKVIPLAIFAYQAKAHKNHELIKDKMREVVRTDEDRPYRRINHPNSHGYTMVPADWTDEQITDLMKHVI